MINDEKKIVLERYKYIIEEFQYKFNRGLHI